MATVGELELIVRVAGEEQASSALRRLKAAEDAAAASAKKLADAGEKSARGLRALLRPTDEAKAKGRQLGEVLNQITETAFGFTATLGRANPAIFQLGVNLAGAGNSAYQLGSAFGPLGVAIGATLGLLPSLIQWLSDTSDEMDQVADSAKETVTWLQQLQREISAVKAAQREALQQQLFREGLAGPEELAGQARIVRRQYGAAVAAAVRQFGDLRGDVAARLTREIERLIEAGGATTDAVFEAAHRAGVPMTRAADAATEVSRIIGAAAQIRREAERLEAAAKRAREEANAILLEEEEARDFMRSEDEQARARRRAERERRRRARAAARAARQRARDEQREEERLLFGRADAAREAYQVVSPLLRQWEAERRAAEKHEKDILRIRRRMMRKIRQEFDEWQEELKALYKHYIETVTESSEALMEAFVSGQSIPEAMGKIVAEAISKEARVQAAKEVAAAASAFATGNVGGGAAHTAAAAAWAAVPPLASALFGGSGGAAPAPTSGRGATAMPRADVPEGAADAGGRQVVVNINAPVPEQMLGRDIERARREAMRRFGR